MPYAIEKGLVTFDGKTIRGSDASSFRVLTGGFARDDNAIYQSGSKIQRIDPASFAMLSANVGGDKRKLFYRRCNGHLVHDQRAKGTDRLTILETDSQLFAKTDTGVWSLSEYGAIDLCERVNADAKTFAALARSYAKDARAVFWFDDEGRPTRLGDADPGSFVVDDNGAIDKNGRFFGAVRDSGALPVETERDPAVAADRVVAELWLKLLPTWFARFDSEQSTDLGLVDAPVPPLNAASIPPHALRRDGGWLVLEVAGASQRGRVSAMELLAGWLWGVARSKVGVVRVLPRTENDIAEEKENIGMETLDLAFLFDKLDEKSEAALLVQRVLEHHQHRHKKPEFNPEARAERLVPHLFMARATDVSGPDTTTHMALARLQKSGKLEDPQADVRWLAFATFREIVRHTSAAPTRLFDRAKSSLRMLDDPEPAIVASAARAFDDLCMRVFNDQSYEAALTLADALAAHGFNLDLQLARRWESLSALARDEDAEAAWQKLQAVSTTAERAPRQYGMHSDYSSWAMWRVFAELRLARAHMWAHERKHPSQELRAKNRAFGNERTPEEWAKRASARVVDAAAIVQAWVQDAPAWFIGPMLAEFDDELARVTGKGRIEGIQFHTYTQAREYRRYTQPYVYHQAKLEAAGEYERIGAQRYRLSRATTDIHLSLGGAFGIEFRFLGEPRGRALPICIRVTPPGKEPLCYSTHAHLGLRETFVWSFEKTEELIAGPWLIEVELFDAEPAVYPGKKLEPKERIAQLAQTFSLWDTRA
jgi:hypothetical protein